MADAAETIAPGRVLISARGITKQFGGVEVLSDVDLDLAKGEIVWQVAHGETPDAIRNHPALKGLDIPRTGRTGRIGTLSTK